MKKSSFLAIAVFCLLLSFCSNAQTKTGSDYFEGKWTVIIKGTPNGDAKMILSLEKKDTTMTGVVLDTTGKETTKITSLELKPEQITVYFTAQGYDVSLVLDKKDDDHVTGNLLGMFQAEGDRIKVTK